jgi:hypothetical protein
LLRVLIKDRDEAAGLITRAGEFVTDQADAPTGYWAGSRRLVAPEETLEAVRRFFPVMGITRAADITGIGGQGARRDGGPGVRCYGKHRSFHGRADRPAAHHQQRERSAVLINTWQNTKRR